MNKKDFRYVNKKEPAKDPRKWVVVQVFIGVADFTAFVMRGFRRTAAGDKAADKADFADNRRN